MYDLGSRFYDPVLGRFLNADDVDILEVQDDLYDKNLYAYCDNNPINRVDEEGDFWQLALTGGTAGAGSSLAAIGSSVMAGIGSITPVGWVVIGTIAVVGVISVGIKYSKGKIKENEDVDPYARSGQKKQGRELKNKSRLKGNFKSRNNKRNGKPAKPKHHTPGSAHQKYEQQ